MKNKFHPYLLAPGPPCPGSIQTSIHCPKRADTVKRTDITITSKIKGDRNVNLRLNLYILTRRKKINKKIPYKQGREFLPTLSVTVPCFPFTVYSS